MYSTVNNPGIRKIKPWMVQWQILLKKPKGRPSWPALRYNDTLNLFSPALAFTISIKPDSEGFQESAGSYAIPFLS